MHVLELQCHFWEDCGYTEGISQHDLQGKMVKKPEKERSKTTTNAPSVFCRNNGMAKVPPSFHSDAITSQVPRYFPALGSTAEITSPWQTEFQQFFPVCWPEPEFSLMLNINIQTLLLFSPCINEVSTGRGERYSLLPFCCDNVKQKPCSVLSRGPSLSYRKHNCTLLKYHPGATERWVDVLSDLLRQWQSPLVFLPF